MLKHPLDFAEIFDFEKKATEIDHEGRQGAQNRASPISHGRAKLIIFCQMFSKTVEYKKIYP